MRIAVIPAIIGLAGVVLAAQGGQAPPVASETTARCDSGVIAAGTKIEVIKSGFSGTEGPIGLPDGSLIFTETQANRITRIDANNQTSTFLESTNGSNGLAFDSKGRLISVQTTPGKTLIGVIYPKGQEATLSETTTASRTVGRTISSWTRRVASTSASRGRTLRPVSRHQRRRSRRPCTTCRRAASRSGSPKASSGPTAFN
jgi:hypothetical protein